MSNGTGQSQVPPVEGSSQSHSAQYLHFEIQAMDRRYIRLLSEASNCGLTPRTVVRETEACRRMIRCPSGTDLGCGTAAVCDCTCCTMGFVRVCLRRPHRTPWQRPAFPWEENVIPASSTPAAQSSSSGNAPTASLETHDKD